jgi:S1-C subfamily serine protease
VTRPPEFVLHGGRRPQSAVPLVLAGVALVLTAWLTFDRLWPTTLRSDAAPRAITPRGDLAEFEKLAMAVFDQTSPSVVHITSPEVPWQVDPYRSELSREGTGTGFVWDERGYIVTNYHVVRGRDRVAVRFPNLDRYDALVVDSEPSQDIAVIKLVNPPSDLRPVLIGTSRDLRVGQAVFAIGNPFGLDNSLTSGIVSALDRNITSVAGTPILGVIQVDAAINPGNSGGPLLDSAGRVIGMNTAIVSPSGASAGIGFAVPIDSINRVVPRLISGDRGQRPALGIYSRTITLSSGARRPMVISVVDGSGAAKAGLQPTTETGYGDVILSIDGVEVGNDGEIRAILDQKSLGETVQVRILRNPGSRPRELVVPVELSTVTQR